MSDDKTKFEEKNVNNSSGAEPVNSSRDESEPEAEELYVDSADLADMADKKPGEGYEGNFFRKDGSGSAPKDFQEKKPKALASSGEPGGVSEHSLTGGKGGKGE